MKAKELAQRISRMLYDNKMELVVHPNIQGKDYIFIKPKDSDDFKSFIGLTEVKYVQL